MRHGSQASGIPAGRDDGLLNEHLCFQPLTYGHLLPQPQDTHRPCQSARGGKELLSVPSLGLPMSLSKLWELVIGRPGVLQSIGPQRVRHD